MRGAFNTRVMEAEDLPALRALYDAAFPGEDLVPLVTALLTGDWPVLSLGAAIGEGLIGHILFTLSGAKPDARDVALLGPLAVDPGYQRQGVGTALMATGFEALTVSGVRQVCVLGDPDYYHRAGFAPETAVQPPYPLPSEWAGAWQSRCLGDAAPLAAGPLHLPDPWQDKALWLP